jgi:FkbM family methyltransferase
MNPIAPYIEETPQSIIHKGRQLFTAKVRDKEIEILWHYRMQHPFIPPLGHPDNYQRQFEENIKCWETLIKEGSIAIDIGASMLDTTFQMAALVGHGKVLAFEPCLNLQEIIQLQLASNPAFNIEFFNKAVMNEDKEYEFLYDPTETNGGPTLNTSRHPSIYPTKVKVQGVRLQNILESRGIQPKDISFIKVDTEGYDCQVLRSFAEIIKEGRPVIQVENFPDTKGEIVQFAQDFNYQAFHPFSLQEGNLSHDHFHDIILKPK